jgi:hypothetical protein
LLVVFTLVRPGPDFDEALTADSED